MNPARAFGPDAANMKFTEYHWIYWIGPILGSLMATGFYILIKALEYETVNPGQDDDGLRYEYDSEKGDFDSKSFDMKSFESETIEVGKV